MGALHSLWPAETRPSKAVAGRKWRRHSCLPGPDSVILDVHTIYRRRGGIALSRYFQILLRRMPIEIEPHGSKATDITSRRLTQINADKRNSCSSALVGVHRRLVLAFASMRREPILIPRLQEVRDSSRLFGTTI